MIYENLLMLLEELSLRASNSEDETNNYKDGTDSALNNFRRNITSDYTSSSNLSSPAYEQLDNVQSADEDVELKSAVDSLFQELSSPNSNNGPSSQTSTSGYDKSKLLVALLGNIDPVTCAIKKINNLVSLGKKMEQIYRRYYADPNVPLDLEEIDRLIVAFSEVYNSESYVREVNVSRVYQAYCQKLIEIYRARRDLQNNSSEVIMALDP
jgi:hypothetical protein